METDWTNLIEVLGGVKDGVLVPIVLGFLWSFAAENLPAWHNVTARGKQFLGVFLSGALPVLAALSLAVLQSEPVELTPEVVWALAGRGIIAWVAAQGAYVAAKTVGYGAQKHTDK